MAWTQPKDVKDRWIGGAFPVEDEQLMVLIGDAEDTVLAEFPDIENRITTGSTPLVRVQKVVARVVSRFLRNPQGIRQTNTTTGPYTTSETYGGDEPGSMSLTDEDRREIVGARTGRRAFTVDPMSSSVSTNPLAGAVINSSGVEPVGAWSEP